MNLNPANELDPVFHFLDLIITEWRVYLFLAFVWLSVFLIAWIFSGGLRRKFSSQPHVSAGIGIIITHKPPPQSHHKHPPPPPPPPPPQFSRTNHRPRGQSSSTNITRRMMARICKIRLE